MSMTNAELRTLLSEYPDDMEVIVACDYWCRPVLKVDYIVEIESNVVKVEIIAGDKPDFSALAGKISEEIWLNKGQK